MSSNENEEKNQSSNPREIKFEDAFDLTGHGKFNHIVLITCGLIMLNVSMESLGMSYIITAAECDLGLTSKDKGMVTSSAFIGIVSTSFLWGYLSDVYGRRKVMLPATLTSAVFSIASSFASNVWWLAGLRMITGCLVSASSATVYAYLGEMHTTAKRASAIAWGSVFISFGFLILPGFAWIVIPGRWSFPFLGLSIVPWRVFVWCWCIPGLMAAVALMFLPESPRYILSSKGAQEAIPILAKMYAWNHGCKAEDFPAKKIITLPESQSRGFASELRHFKRLFRPPLLRCVLISHMSMFTVYMISSGLYIWVPDILNNILNNKSQRSLTICEIIHDKAYNMTRVSSSEMCKTELSVAIYPISMSMGAVFALTFLAIGLFINKAGKKTLYCGIMIGCGICTLLSTFVSQSIVAIILLILCLCSGCAASILASISVDVFPTRLRAMAMCTMYMLGRMGAAFGAYILGVTLDFHCLTIFVIFGVICAGHTILMIFWPNPAKVRTELEDVGLTY